MPEVSFQPTLRGPNITLLPLQPEHLASLQQAASDPLIWQQHPEPTRYQPEVFAGFFQSALASGSAFTIVDHHSQQVIGSSRYYDWDPSKHHIVIGYTFLTRPYWGGSTNAELKKLMLDYAAQFAEMAWLCIGSNNMRSRRAAEKLGFTFSHEQLDVVDGIPRDRVHYYYQLLQPASCV